MRKHDAHWKRRLPSLSALVFLVCVGTAAAEQPSATAVACAERETQLMSLVETYGAAPNAATQTLADESLTLQQAKADCEAGRTREAFAAYDRVIGKLTATMAQSK